MKDAPNEIIGVCGVGFRNDGALELSYLLAPAYRGNGLMTEAVQALIDTAFTLTEAKETIALIRVSNAPARRVLENCGFQHIGLGMDQLSPRLGTYPCDHFKLDRRAWGALKGWRTPVIDRLLIDVGINALESSTIAA